jgi:EPS-associated MarR family transcriptional regulator
LLTDETRYRILRLLEADPHASQRKIATELGISLGRVNYCIQALVDKGLVKVNNFRHSTHKRAYLYLLTPRGIEEKTKVTLRFLDRKLKEYDMLKHEVEELRREAAKLGADKVSRDAPEPAGTPSAASARRPDHAE